MIRVLVVGGAVVVVAVVLAVLARYGEPAAPAPAGPSVAPPIASISPTDPEQR